MQRKGNLFVLSGPCMARARARWSRGLPERVPDAVAVGFPTPRALRVRAKSTDGLRFFVDDAELRLSWSLRNGQSSSSGLVSTRIVMERRALASKSTWLRVAKCFSKIDVHGRFPDSRANSRGPSRVHRASVARSARKPASWPRHRLRRKHCCAHEECAGGGFAHKMEYDKQFVNDDLEACTDELVAYIESQAKMCEE